MDTGRAACYLDWYSTALLDFRLVQGWFNAAVIRAPIRFVGLALLIALVVVLTGCTRSHPQSTFDTYGPVAESQLNLFYLIFWAAVLVFVVVEGILLYAAIRFRRRPGQGDPDQIHGHRKLEIAWTIAPAIVLVVIAIPTVIVIFDNLNAPPETELTVEAIGHQWWFEFRYPHPANPDEEIVTANELHIPVGEPVSVNLDSVDVLHSFWIPKIAGKVDMVPNNNNEMWIQADEPGEYFGQCAEFCGEAHANMRFRVIAQAKPEFDAWLLEQASPMIEPLEPLALEGQQVFSSAGCSGCHALSSTVNRPPEGSTLKRTPGRVGPNLTHFASRGQMAAGIMEQDPENLRRWLEDPEAVKPGNIMARDARVFTDPDEALTEPEISALIAFLRGLR